VEKKVIVSRMEVMKIRPGNFQIKPIDTLQPSNLPCLRKSVKG
jgi:hypothetical protein